jgi:hypothetical protein
MKTLFQQIEAAEKKKYTEYRKGQMVSVIVRGTRFVGRYDRYDKEYSYHFVEFPVANEKGNITLEASGFTESQVKEA